MSCGVVADAAWIPRFSGRGVGWQLKLQFDPSLETSICHRSSPKKEKKKIFFMGPHIWSVLHNTYNIFNVYIYEFKSNL